MRCPFPFSAALIGYRMFSQFRFSARQGLSWVVREPVWWWQAIMGIPFCLRKANPFSWEGYRRWLRLPAKF